jgi:predicted RNA-binding Zn ribbon-like protein
MDVSEPSIRSLNLVGGRLCLDFTNTVDRHRPETEGERLTSYRALVAWGEHAGAISQEVASRLLATERKSPVAGEEALRRAVELREAIFRLSVAAIERRPPRASDLRLLNVVLSQALSRLLLQPSPDDLALDWPEDDVPLERVLWPVARSAAEVLSSPEDLSRLHQCAAEDCAWLFLDQSRNRSRRWCDMADCGNRAKARRFYAQRHAARGGQG